MKNLVVRGFCRCNFEDIKDDLLKDSLSVYFEEDEVTVNFFKVPFREGIERIYAEKVGDTDTFSWPYFQLKANPVALIYNNELTIISDSLKRWKLFSNLPKELDLFDFSLEMKREIVDYAISKVPEVDLDAEEMEKVVKTALAYYFRKPSYNDFIVGNLYNAEVDFINSKSNFCGKFTNADDWREKAAHEFLEQSFITPSQKTIFIKEHMSKLKTIKKKVKELYKIYCENSGDHTLLKDIFDKANLKDTGGLCTQQYEIVILHGSFRLYLTANSFMMNGSWGYLVVNKNQQNLEIISKIANEPELIETKLFPIKKVIAIRNANGSVIWENR